MAQTPLLHGTSLFDARYAMLPSQYIEEKNNLRIFPLNTALIHASPKFFTQYPTDARTALSLIRDASELLHDLLDEGRSTIAGRLCGAFRNIGNDRIADDIKKTMVTAGFSLRETDPFTTEAPAVFSGYERSPYVTRMNTMWYEMRKQIIAHFPKSPGIPSNTDIYLQHVDDTYLTDAYHSLSIEGYQVSAQLIEKVRQGNWNPDSIEYDKNQRDALAARGYWQAFNAVKTSIVKVFETGEAGKIVAQNHGDWYRAMFQPCVAAGILKISDLAGYRNNFVFIRRSMHVPPRHEAIRDLMPAFFQCLREESEVSVRVVLGHFFFVYIHPYMDGNGRMGRFLMNVMLASGGYPWTVIPVERRTEYMEALEEASVNQNILPFCLFIASCIQ